MTASFFRWLTIIVLAGLFIHMSLDFFARHRETKKAKKEGASLKTARLPENEYQRFNPNFLAQHLLLAVSVILLSLS
ncbi:MAG: hypothetical protein J7K32_00295, partial [Deltaproteobacteria bacterium]|nr:hypothetical protein [Deltaproteobacteria bacterium]